MPDRMTEYMPDRMVLVVNFPFCIANHSVNYFAPQDSYAILITKPHQSLQSSDMQTFSLTPGGAANMVIASFFLEAGSAKEL